MVPEEISKYISLLFYRERKSSEERTSIKYERNFHQFSFSNIFHFASKPVAECDVTLGLHPSCSCCYHPWRANLYESQRAEREAEQVINNAAW